jgi:hypothetical protein
MFCKQFEKAVWDYLDGRDDGFSAHLKECPRCGETLAKARKLLNLLKEGAAPVPPAAYRESFWPRLKEKITARETQRQPFSILKLNPLYYAAMTAAAALILWVSIRTPDSTIYMASSTESPNYIMAPAGRRAAAGSPEINYISGPGGEREDKVDYILPGTMPGAGNSWAV